jgi:hypothetical protein
LRVLTIKFGKLIFVAAIGLAIVIGLAFFVPELGLTRGHAHVQFSTIRQGGVPHSSAVIWLGWVFGIVTLILVFSLFSLGAAHRDKLRGLGKPFVIVFALAAAAWSGIVVTYQGYISNPDQALLFGFPLPTGLMIFVFPSVSLLITILFVVRFPKSILTEADLEKYRQLLDDEEKNS